MAENRPPEDVRQQLFETNKHLAECIDEIVYAENAQAEAEKRLDVTEECLQDALGYITSLESQVLVPAFTSLSMALTDQARKQRNNMENAGDRVSSLDPSDRTKNLLRRIREPSEETKKKYSNERDAILNQQAGGYPVDLETAFVTTELFLQSKEELRALLVDAKKRAAGGGAAANNMSAVANDDVVSSSDMSAAMYAQAQQLSEQHAKDVDAMKQELIKTRQQLEKVTYDRDALVVKLAEQPKPYAELQAQHVAEKENLQKQVTQLKAQQQQQADERFALRERFETLQRALDQAYQEKALIVEEHAKAEAQKGTVSLAQQSQYQEETHQLRLQIDTITREHSATVTTLESQVAQLRMELSNARGTNSAHDREAVAQLQRTNQSLRNDLASMQQRLLSSSPSVEGALDTKIQAFEMTISALNSELAMVEGKIASVERHYTDERARIVRNFDDERRRFQMEREECDALVLKMTNELECLVRENAALKQRIR